MSMVERVARAMEPTMAKIVDELLLKGAPKAKAIELLPMDKARAAIEEMRDSLSATRLAIVMHDIDHLRGPMRESNVVFRTFWTAAIDAALTQGESE